ncbi:MAG: ImmA/IrrE family metallo-endopeptidase [Planctomycetes bacterium]|nr:ImmA/IrrE family metallo-endopeptidase [Planctomycetota bacterium]
MTATDPQSLGKRLQIARTSVGITQQQAAHALGLARTTVVAIEADERPVSSHELVQFAELYKTNTNALQRRYALQVDLATNFRRTTVVSGNEEASLATIEVLRRLATATVELEHRLGKQIIANYPALREIGRGNVDQQAEDLALEIRGEFGLGHGPIQDLFSFLELELGVRVFLHSLPSNISGVFAYSPEIGACILINSNHPSVRQNISAAHEFGHLLTTRRRATEVCLDHDNIRTERFATRFAAAFLMPAPAIRKVFKEYVGAEGRFSARHLVLMAHQFNVSSEAMARRLEQLEVLPAQTFERLQDRGLTKTIERAIIGAEAETTHPARRLLRLASLVVEAHERGMLSEQQVASMFALDQVEARDLIDTLKDEEAEETDVT